MGILLDEGLALIDEGIIRVTCVEHAAGVVGDATIWVQGNVVN